MTQLSLFDWRPPPAPPRAVRRDVAERALNVALHERPDPKRVYALTVSHGYEAAAERWWWCSKSDLSRLISQGRALTVGTRSERVRRSLTPADEQRVVEAVLELGGIIYAAEACGVPESMVRTILRERGVDYPRASGRRQDAAAARQRLADYVARRAA